MLAQTIFHCKLSLFYGANMALPSVKRPETQRRIGGINQKMNMPKNIGGGRKGEREEEREGNRQFLAALRLLV
jgi:hypothetical protein